MAILKNTNHEGVGTNTRRKALAAQLQCLHRTRDCASEHSGHLNINEKMEYL